MLMGLTQTDLLIQILFQHQTIKLLMSMQCGQEIHIILHTIRIKGISLTMLLLNIERVHQQNKLFSLITMILETLLLVGLLIIGQFLKLQLTKTLTEKLIAMKFILLEHMVVGLLEVVIQELLLLIMEILNFKQVGNQKMLQ